MVDLNDIPDFPGMPGQRPTPGDPPSVSPIAVVLVTAPLDSEGMATPLNAAAVDAFIAAEIAAGGTRAYSTTVERWAPWSSLDVSLGFAVASKYNYGRFVVGGKSFYAYVSVDYQNLTTSTLTPTPDDWTTYAPSIGYSTVVRSHVAIAASLSDTYGDQYLTAPEPIDAPPVRGVLSADLLSSLPSNWTVLVVSANDLRGGTGNPFWDRHVEADLIAGAANLASSATVDSSGTVQAVIPSAQYPWAVGGSGVPDVVDTISPAHTITNPGGTIASAWQWHIDNNGGRGGVDWNYAYGTDFTAPADGVVDHFDVVGVGMVVRLTLNTPAARINPQEPDNDQYGPILSIWFQHCSAAYDGPASQGDVIGKSGDGYGAFTAHLHVHALTNTSSVAGSTNRANFWGFVEGGGVGPDVYVPKVTGSAVSTIDGIAAGGGVYLFTIDGFAEYMTIMQGAPWVTSGIIDTRLVPTWAIGAGGDASYTPAKSSTDPNSPIWAVAAAIPVFVGEVSSDTITATVLSNWRASALSAVGATGWTKLLTSQFTEILVGNGDGPRSFVPEQWHTSSLGFLAVTGAAHGESSIRVLPAGYNELGSQMGIESPIGGQAGLTHSGYGLAGSNTASQVLTPYLSAFGSHQAWAIALLNKQLATTLGLTNIQLNAGTQGVSTVMGAVQSAAGGALVAGGPGAIMGAAAGAVGSIGSMATAGIQTQNAITMLDVAQDGSFDITALSLAMSGGAAVASFDSWKQSLSAVSGSGAAHRLASAWRSILGQTFDVIVSMPSVDAVRRAVSTWKRYGYMVNRAFVPPRLDAMDHFTYWQLDDPTVLGSMPAESRARIIERFTRGTTIWTTVSEIGSQPTNTPRAGVTY